jgi:hypothetical protein
LFASASWKIRNFVPLAYFEVVATAKGGLKKQGFLIA